MQAGVAVVGMVLIGFVVLFRRATSSDDRQRGLLGRAGAEVEADEGVQPVEVLRGEPYLCEPALSLFVRAARTWPRGRCGHPPCFARCRTASSTGLRQTTRGGGLQGAVSSVSLQTQVPPVCT